MAQGRKKTTRKSRSRSPGQTVESLRRSLTRERHQRSEAIEQQQATAEILKAISESPTDIRPVFQAIAERAARLCEAGDATVFMVNGEKLESVAHSGNVPRAAPSQSIDRGWLTGRAVIDRAPVQVEDVLVVPEEFPTAQITAKPQGVRTVLSVPLMLKDVAVGAITLRRREVRPFSDKQIALLKTFADQAAIAIENVRLFNETREALERQTATADILRVISSTPTDTRPVFDAIVEATQRLIGGKRAVLLLRHDESFVAVAYSGPSMNAPPHAQYVPLDPRQNFPSRCILNGEVVHVPDWLADDVPEFEKGVAKAYGVRSGIQVPLLRKGVGIGAIAVAREHPGPYDDREVALLRSFADQAVIAIENVRLFNETKEALERQTATADILKVISGSPTDVRPVFDAIVRSAIRLLGGFSGGLFIADGGQVQIGAALTGSKDSTPRFQLDYPAPIDYKAPTVQAIREARIVNVPDVLEFDYSERVKERARLAGYRSSLCVPMMRGDAAIGSIAVTRTVTGVFPENHVKLLKTFADQAVIAIENVRLFKELEARNKDLGESLEQQTATAEILKVISSSPTDVQPVLNAIVRSAASLFDPCNAAILMRDSRGLQLRAIARGEGSEELMKLYPLPFDPAQFPSARAISEQRIIELPDANAASVSEFVANAARAGKFRSAAFVPLLREGEGVGTIVLTHPRPGFRLTEKQQVLMRTFADQAVIAIENVRLFKEIQEKSAQLEVANKHKSEFLANMSHELRTPLNAIIGFAEVLSERMFGEVNEKQADYLKDIHESGKHLLSLINDILDLSKIEAGRMELELSSFHLPSAVSNAVTLIRERALRHGIALSVAIDERLGQFQADERKVKQILLNLLSNAVKFTPDGGRVDVSAKLDTDKIEIAVKDSGVGMTPEDQASLFEEFKQLGKDRSRKAEGTGLGLALTKKFVELHGGAMRVESAPGKGSTFMFSLPMRA